MKANYTGLADALSELGIQIEAVGGNLIVVGNKIQLDSKKNRGPVVYVLDNINMIRPSDFGFSVRIKGGRKVCFEPNDVSSHT